MGGAGFFFLGCWAFTETKNIWKVPIFKYNSSLTNKYNGMRSNHWKLLTSLLILTLALACEKEEIAKEINVDLELESYWLKFVEEAENRGVDLQLDTLDFSIGFAQLDSLNVTTAGKCYGLPGGDILIDVDEWESSDEVRRELLMFHELGHCVLGRHHTNPYGYLEENLRTYTCISLMTSCLCGSSCGIDYYSAQWRTFYLDELFGLSAEPEWISDGTDYEAETFDEALLTIADSITTELTLPDINCDGSNLQLEVELAGHSDFVFETGGVRYEFSASNGELGIFVAEALVFDLDFINSWAQLNEDWWNVSFTYRHLDGIDYFYLKETLIHSREGDGACGFISVRTSAETNIDLKLAI